MSEISFIISQKYMYMIETHKDFACSEILTTHNSEVYQIAKTLPIRVVKFSYSPSNREIA